ncbi:MAG: SprB repeat-containing protein, partial [Flavobacteriales bacterium]|nr:SprB repeat-containing protein [Flavobacteriales bacterium]
MSDSQITARNLVQVKLMPKIKYIALFISILFCGLLPGPTKAEVLTLPLLNAESGKGTPSFFATGMRSGHSVILTAYSVSCNDSCDGSVKATVSGGVGPFSYDWIGSPPGSPADSIFTLCNGNYSVVVFDLFDGSFIFTSVDVLEPPEVGAIFIPVSPGTNCFGICDGASTAIGTGGNGGPYTYAWNNPASESTAAADSLCPGDNIVTIWDCCGCVGTDTVTLAEPPQLLANVGGLAILCNGACNGQAWGVPTGGIPGYTHSWNTGSTDDTLFNLCPGTYVDTVRDLNGCISIQSFVVTQPASLTLTMDSTNESCGGLCDGVVRVTVVGGSTPYAYVWNDFFVQTNDSAFALCVGMYTVIVTDAAGCSDTDSIAVGSPPVLTVTTDTIHVLCATDSTGSAIALPVGGDGTYFYIWDDVGGQTTATATNLPDGTYCVTVTDGLGCTNSACAEVLEPPLLDVDATGTNVTCNGACDGIGTPIFSGGVTPYAFLWDDFAAQTNAVATNLCAPVPDTVCVTLTDANGCTDTACVIITEPTVLTTIETKTDESCNGACDGTGTITASGGTLPYAYLWCNGNTSSTATALCAGKCYVTVTDNNGCSVVDSVIIIAPPILDVTATFVDPLCGGVCDGTAEAFPVGGTAPYAYSWTPPPPPIQTTKIATGLCSGVYTVEVTDDNGCQDATTVTITPPVILTLSMDSTLISCNGADDGTGTANPGGGTGPYAYLWDDPLAQTTQIATNLPPGTWCVTVTDAAGCTISGCRDFVDPPLLTVAMSKTDISCFGLCDGTGTATPAGGTLPYFYIWDDPLAQTNALATGLCAGPVNVTVTDNNGCTVIGTVTIIEPSDINPNITTLPSTCGNSDGSACVAPTGGTPCALPTPYGINWYTLPAFTSCIVLQAAGSYGVEITDCNGCIDSSSAFIADIASHTVVMSDTDVTCAEDSNGIGLGLATLGTPPYAYQWLDNSGTPIVGETDSVIFNLWPGTYILQIGDALGCTIFDTVFITQPDSLFANLTAVDVLCFGDNNGSASTVPSGGIAPYTYMWETGAITSTISALFPGWYTDTLRDNNGCLVIDSVEVNSQLVLTLATDT